MTSSIGEPLILSHYGISKVSIQQKTPSRASKTSVFATHCNSPSSSEGLVTVTSQGDGIHIIDLASLHPVISHTLGPSSVFSCPAVSRTEVVNSKNICTTYAAMHSFSDIRKEESGRLIWIWYVDLDGNVSDRASQKKKSLLIPHAVSGIYVIQDPDTYVIAWSSNGSLSLIREDMNISTRVSKDENGRLLEAFIFYSNACTFSSSPKGAVIALICSVAGGIQLQILGVDSDGGLSEIDNCQIQLDPTQVVEISMSVSGCLTFLMHSGAWHSYELHSSTLPLKIVASATEHVNLTSLSFISPTLPRYPSGEVSVLSLGSSFILLAGISTGTAREIVLLLWDIQFPVILASHTLPIPFSVSQSKDLTFGLKLSPAGSHVLLVLSPILKPHTRQSQDMSSLRSCVLAIPISVPSNSTVANALGRSASTSRWTAPSTDDQICCNGQPQLNEHIQVIKDMRFAMEQNRPQAASKHFFNDWQQPAARRLQNGQELSLPYSFVKDLLSVTLQPSRPANMPYSSEVVRYLLDRRSVSATMIDEGLLAILRFRGDWKSVESALRNVPDIPEVDVISTLVHVVRYNCQHPTPADAESMQVDSMNDIPSTSHFLSHCIRYSMSPAALRSALYEHFQDGDDILCILLILKDWVAQWESSGATNCITLKDKVNTGEEEVPDYSTIISFLQILLDATFLVLLQHRPAHNLLRDILSLIEPEISLIDQIEQLRGPLERFARLQAKMVKEGKKKEPQDDWRKRRKQAHDQANVGIGTYRLEELVL